jgi:hypothetical protein
LPAILLNNVIFPPTEPMQCLRVVCVHRKGGGEIAAHTPALSVICWSSSSAGTYICSRTHTRLKNSCCSQIPGNSGHRRTHGPYCCSWMRMKIIFMAPAPAACRRGWRETHFWREHASLRARQIFLPKFVPPDRVFARSSQLRTLLVKFTPVVNLHRF